MGKELSFSQQVKKELCKQDFIAPCCITAACYGIACFAKYFDARGVVLHTERAYIAQWIKKTFTDAGIEGKIYSKSGNGKNNKLYEFTVKDPFEIEKMFVLFSHTGDETAVRIRTENFLCNTCYHAFICAAFLCCGTIINPEKGYALEFISGRFKLMEDFKTLLAHENFIAKSAVRKGINVLYFKASEQIEDLLTFMGASGAALEIMNLKVYKDFRNIANRITNCETANIDKIVSANRQVLNAIELLEKHGAIASLPEAVQEAAFLRKNNPLLSLSELSVLFSTPVSKSGLSHRFKKICDKAAQIKNLQKPEQTHT